MKAKNISNLKIGNVKALSYFDTIEIGASKKHRWRFRCDCGKEFVTRKDSFLRKAVTSCGCKMSTPMNVGDGYGDWTIVGQEYRLGRKLFQVLCQCGNNSLVSYTDLRSGRSTKCLDCGWDRYEAEESGDSARRAVYNQYKKNALSRNREFSIGFEEFKNLISLPCAYSGHPPAAIAKPIGQRRNKYSSVLYSGLDRVDNTKGYTIDNVVPCCTPCNKAKGGMPREQWEAWIAEAHWGAYAKEKK